MARETSDANLLFLDQGRAFPTAAMGHSRARDALAVGGSPTAVEVEHLSVPAVTRAQRRFLHRVEALGDANLQSLRYVLVRSWAGRRLLRARLRRDTPALVHVTTDQVALLFGNVPGGVPRVLSLDTLYLNWARMNNGVAADAPTPWYLQPVARLERRALNRAQAVVAWTRTVASDVSRFAPRAEVVVLHPGLDLDTFRPAGAATPGPTPGRSRVLFVGGDWGRKGGPELVEALRPELGRTVELDVVSTASIPHEEGVTVHRAAPGSPDLLKLFARADIFCLPTRVDAAPWVVLEAMACGVPVVSTRVGSIPEMVGDGGRVVDPGDVTALRSTLVELIGAPEARLSMSEAGRSRVETDYDARKNTPALLELLGSLARIQGEAAERP